MADARDAIDAGHAPGSPAGLALARRWMTLFSSYAGKDPPPTPSSGRPR